jgi:hypothetical protein
MAQARQDPSIWNARVLDPAVRLGLVIAENDGAVAIAGVGHRFPSVEVWSLAATGVPGAAREEEQHAVADLLHAVHAGTGARVPINEEWHHAPPDVDVRMPWHVVLKWRISTPAGFEGDTKIYTNTIGPWDVRERMVTALGPLPGQRGSPAESSLSQRDDLDSLTSWMTPWTECWPGQRPWWQARRPRRWPRGISGFTGRRPRWPVNATATSG